MGRAFPRPYRQAKLDLPVGWLLVAAKGLGMIALAVAGFTAARRLERS